MDAPDEKAAMNSSAVLNRAYIQALDKGLSVYVSASSPNGGMAIFEVFPDGKRLERKKLEPPLQVAAGTIVRLP